MSSVTKRIYLRKNVHEKTDTIFHIFTKLQIITGRRGSLLFSSLDQKNVFEQALVWTNRKERNKETKKLRKKQRNKETKKERKKQRNKDRKEERKK